MKIWGWWEGRKNRPWVPVAGAILLAMIAGSCAGTGQVAGEGGSRDSGITGVVRLEDNRSPVAGAHVYAYRDYSKNLMGVADYVSRGSNSEGTYQLDLPPGEYYLVARKRASGANYGPIVTGDLYDHRFEEKAVKIQKGRYLPQDFALTRLKEPLFFQIFTEETRKTGTGIRGRIFDAQGSPAAGAFATAYTNENMKRLPDYASTVTDDEGRYTIYLPRGGRYFIGARSHARRVPERGEPVGRYKGSGDHSVEVPEGGFVEGIDIRLQPFQSEVPAGYRPY